MLQFALHSLPPPCMRASLPLTYPSIYHLHHLHTNPTLTPTHHSPSAIMTCAVCPARRTSLPSIFFNSPRLPIGQSFFHPSIPFLPLPHHSLSLPFSKPLHLSLLRNVFREKHPLIHSTPFHFHMKIVKGRGASSTHLPTRLPICGDRCQTRSMVSAVL